MKIAVLVLLLVEAAFADLVTTVGGTKVEGVVAPFSSESIAIGLLPSNGGKTQNRCVLAISDVRSIAVDDTGRFCALRDFLRSSGTNVVFQPDSMRRPTVSGWRVLQNPPQAQGRDPAMAGLLSALVPTLGHAYAGHPGKGAGFFVLEVIEGVTAGVLLKMLATSDFPSKLMVK